MGGLLKKRFETFQIPGTRWASCGIFPKVLAYCGQILIEEVQKVFDDRRVPETLNSTHIALIPKIQGSETLGNYRPISLCNTVYKVVTKIIVARLRSYLNKLISPMQTVFVLGRKGIDNIIIA